MKTFLWNVENKVYRAKTEAAAVDFNGHMEEVNYITFLMC
jgi:hypothetical protein